MSYADIKALYVELDIKYLSNSAWLINKDLFSYLAGAADNNGNPIFMFNNTGTDTKSPAGYLLGRPCYVSYMPDDTPLAFGDFNNYKIIHKMPVIQRINEKFSKDGVIGFIMRGFVDAKLLLNDSVIALEV